MRMATTVKPVCYRTHRTLLQRLQPVLTGVAVLLAVAVPAFGAAGLIARLHVTEVQLDAAYLQGFAAGQTVCRSN